MPFLTGLAETPFHHLNYIEESPRDTISKSPSRWIWFFVVCFKLFQNPKCISFAKDVYFFKVAVVHVLHLGFRYSDT